MENGFYVVHREGCSCGAMRRSDPFQFIVEWQLSDCKKLQGSVLKLSEAGLQESDFIAVIRYLTKLEKG